ncbi:MAG: Na+:solute symporter [Candidatus Eisenbacteria sp.]|nr:Na+:solute symporter [Candidatus Eisenbacteria bacterium]
MKLATWDWILIAFYGAIMLSAAAYFSRRASRSMADFFVSGRSLPWWVAGTSMVATTFAADTPLLVTSIVRSEGVAGNWIWFNFAISHALTTFFLAALWRRARVITDVELCEHRYSGVGGRGLRFFKGTLFAFVTNSIVLGWVILAMATICEEVLGLPKLVTIGASIVLATLYATISGLWGVVVTDLLQFGIAMLGSVVLMIKAFEHVGGVSGFAPTLRTLVAADGRPAMEILPNVATGVLGGFLVAIGVQWWSWKYSDGGGVLIQRMSAARDERHSVLAMLWFTFANYVLRPWPWFAVALISLFVFPELTDHKAAYPQMMTRFLGPGWLGLMMAAILAAFMSTIDTHINLASSYFVNDIYRRFLRRRATERHYVLIARLASPLFLCVGALIAVFNTSIVHLFQFLLQLVAGAGVVFLLRWFWWRINAWSEIVAMAASLLIASLLNVANSHGWFAHQFASWEIILINVVGSGVLWLTATFLTRPTERAHLVAFYRRVRPPGFWNPVAAASLADPGATSSPPPRRGDRPATDSPPVDPPSSGWAPRRRGECVLLTIVLVYSAMIGIGHLLYARWLSGALLAGLALLAALRIMVNLRGTGSGPARGRPGPAAAGNFSVDQPRRERSSRRTPGSER